MKNIKVAIYVNGNNKIGMGHIYRVLEIANELKCKPDIYFDINQTERNIFGKTKHNIISIDGIKGLYEKCRENKYDIFINDILSTSIEYMNGLKENIPDAKIVNFEDEGEGAIKADLVINALLKESKLKNTYSGERYFIAGKEFLKYNPIEIKDKVERIFIIFGGADPQNYTERLLNMVKNDEYKQYKFVFVIGRAKLNIEKLLEYNKFENIEVFYDVSNMPELMSKCDIAVTSRGRTGYELAILGIPAISIAQNEREKTHTFLSDENGFKYIGLNPSDEQIEENLKMFIKMNKQKRKEYQKRQLKHNLKDGKKRVIELINKLVDLT